MGGCCTRATRIAPLKEAQIPIPRSQESDVAPILPVPDQIQHPALRSSSSSLNSDPSNVPGSQDSERTFLPTDTPLLTFPAAEHSPSRHESQHTFSSTVVPALPVSKEIQISAVEYSPSTPKSVCLSPYPESSAKGQSTVLRMKPKTGTAETTAMKQEENTITNVGELTVISVKPKTGTAETTAMEQGENPITNVGELTVISVKPKTGTAETTAMEQGENPITNVGELTVISVKPKTGTAKTTAMEQGENTITNVALPTVIRVRPRTEVTTTTATKIVGATTIKVPVPKGIQCNGTEPNQDSARGSHFSDVPAKVESKQPEELINYAGWPKMEEVVGKKTDPTDITATKMPVPKRTQYNNVDQSPKGASYFTDIAALPVPEDIQYLGAEQNRACLKIFKQLIPRQEDAPHRKEVSQILSDWKRRGKLAEIETSVSNISKNDTQELAAALTRSGAESTRYLLNLESDLRVQIAKAYAVYCWVAKNIQYDLASKLKHQHPDPDPELVLRKRKAICHGYANLFLALTKEAGLESGRIDGHKREWQVNCGCPFEPEDSNSHTWNVVSNPPLSHHFLPFLPSSLPSLHLACMIVYSSI